MRSVDQIRSLLAVGSGSLIAAGTVWAVGGGGGFMNILALVFAVVGLTAFAVGARQAIVLSQDSPEARRQYLQTLAAAIVAALVMGGYLWWRISTGG